MATITGPQFRDLTLEESNALLISKNVGRIAFSLHDQVDIEPINYVSDGEWIFGRTSKGTKLATLLHHPWCAFEVDEVRDLFDWSSVVVKVATLRRNGSAPAVFAVESALARFSAITRMRPAWERSPEAAIAIDFTKSMTASHPRPMISKWSHSICPTTNSITGPCRSAVSSYGPCSLSPAKPGLRPATTQSQN